MNALSKLLSERKWLLADGATGTNYFTGGLEAGDPPELWNEQHPERVTALHREFIDAGADIILTNTFGCNRRRLKLHNADGRCAELNIMAAQIARKIADETSHPIVVAGSVGPTGDLFAPLGELTFDAAVEVFFEQMTALKQGGADIAWIETMSATEEIDAAVTAAERADFDYVYTASFDTAGKTMMGLAPADLQTAAGQHKCSPVAFGANCGVGASDMLVSILAMSEASPEAVIVAKANCGVPKIKGDKVVYTGTPDLMARFARLAIDSGARIIGGCCGTTADHLAAMRQALDDYQPNTPPSTDTIVSQIGPLASPPPAPGAARNRRQNRRRAG